jgi:hypothetical protein
MSVRDNDVYVGEKRGGSSHSWPVATLEGSFSRSFVSRFLGCVSFVRFRTNGPGLPPLYDPVLMAEMLRDDLAAARKAWLDEARRDSEEFVRREQSDFLAEPNHDGKVLDFHSLRHTCGAWLAMTGVHPKVVQLVMRHSSITLTMDTYGHLFPGQEAEAVGRLETFTGPRSEYLAAAGTEDAAPEARSAGRSSCDTKRYVDDTTPYDENAARATLPLAANALDLTALYDAVPSGTMLCDSFAPLAQLAEQLTLNQ